VHYTGYLPEEANDKLKSSVPTHFIITDGIFEDVGGLLNSTLKTVEGQQQARVQKDRLLTDADQPTSTGLVL
jgi:hypothetical protein